MTRNVRQIRILEIIKNNDIRTQEELVTYLERENFKVTQATVSRDIKELGLVKVSDGDFKYKYAYNDDKNKKVPNKLLNMFRECVSSIRYANNIVVVRTLIGSANTAAAMVDTIDNEDILGTVAGDDTIIIVTESLDAAIALCDRLNELLN